MRVDAPCLQHPEFPNLEITEGYVPPTQPRTLLPDERGNASVSIERGEQDFHSEGATIKVSVPLAKINGEASRDYAALFIDPVIVSIGVMCGLDCNRDYGTVWEVCCTFNVEASGRSSGVNNLKPRITPIQLGFS